MYGMDLTYVIFVLPAVFLGFIAQAMVKSSFARYSRVRSRRGISGAQAAAILMRANSIGNVKINHIRGQLTDNYNSGNKTLNLSDATYASTSIAAIGVAAHETGHAIQDKVHYGPLGLRHALYPVANLGSQFGPILAMGGIIFGYTAGRSSVGICQLITNIGLALYAVSVLFYLVTLPVEFNASARAMKILRSTNTLDDEELRGVRKVLTAAAMTYVASAMTAVGSFIRLMYLSNRGRRR